MKYGSLCILSAAIALAAPAAKADKVDDYIKAQMRLNHVPGAAVAIVRNGKVVKLRAYGLANLEWTQKATADTAFQLASTTKPFTGMLVMRLLEQGKLDLDASITRYLPNAPGAWEPVTVRHLANHSSGIPDRVDTEPNPALDAYIEAAAKLPLAHAPGASSEYGISAYIVLRKIIENVSGQTFIDALRTEVIQPLGLKATAYEEASTYGDRRSSEVLPRRASVYDWKGTRFQNFSYDFKPLGYSAGGLYSSAADLAKVLVALEANSLLKEESKRAMWTAQTLGNGKPASFGVGWVLRKVNGRDTTGHSGGPALSDLLYIPKERFGVVVLTNGQALYPYLAQGISELYYPALAASLPAGIEDKKPELTAKVSKVLAAAWSGSVDETEFTPAARENFIPSLKAFLLPFFKSLQPLDRLVLTLEQPGEGKTRREYAALYGKKVVTWQFDVDDAGKVIGFGPKSE
ncbi:serine hydrolase domain-containing protein [Massilia endophytica]|uniref:serine hydrolase domain-containing protein n=1 Tax=Massilia endophytica TaxID=2899220 RepID=UPI001E48E656|nr:serine hydrolase domain-containing protein [Massilia endophytica]UGQ47414.1 beta-lactamase family protein [Massilia endophytica]